MGLAMLLTGRTTPAQTRTYVMFHYTILKLCKITSLSAERVFLWWRSRGSTKAIPERYTIYP